MRGRCALGVALMIAAPASAAREQPPLAGHYYLQGVMEVGSELLLRADGSYEWFMAYGSVDQASKGRWSVKGARVTLHPARPANGQVPVKLHASADWSEEPEFRLRRKLARAEAAELATRCPSMIAGVEAADAALSPGWKPDPALADKAAASLKPLAALREKAEAAAAASVARPGDGALKATADAAVQAYWAQYGVMRGLHRDAGLAPPDVAGPQPPAGCRPTYAEDERNVPAAQWVGRQGVVVADPVLQMGIPQVGIRMDFADGSVAEGQTEGRGFFVPVPQRSSDVRSVTVSFAETGLAPVTLPVDKPGRVLVQLELDYRAAVPAFDTMVLTRTADGLKPDDYGDGLYVRGRGP